MSRSTITPARLAQIQRNARRLHRKQPERAYHDILDHLARQDDFPNWYALQQAANAALPAHAPAARSVLRDAHGSYQMRIDDQVERDGYHQILLAAGATPLGGPDAGFAMSVRLDLHQGEPRITIEGATSGHLLTIRVNERGLRFSSPLTWLRHPDADMDGPGAYDLPIDSSRDSSPLIAPLGLLAERLDGHGATPQQAGLIDAFSEDPRVARAMVLARDNDLDLPKTAILRCLLTRQFEVSEEPCAVEMALADVLAAAGCDEEALQKHVLGMTRTVWAIMRPGGRRTGLSLLPYFRREHDRVRFEFTGEFLGMLSDPQARHAAHSQRWVSPAVVADGAARFAELASSQGWDDTTRRLQAALVEKAIEHRGILARPIPLADLLDHAGGDVGVLRATLLELPKAVCTAPLGGAPYRFPVVARMRVTRDACICSMDQGIFAYLYGHPEDWPFAPADAEAAMTAYIAAIEEIEARAPKEGASATSAAVKRAKLEAQFHAHRAKLQKTRFADLTPSEKAAVVNNFEATIADAPLQSLYRKYGFSSKTVETALYNWMESRQPWDEADLMQFVLDSGLLPYAEVVP